MVHRDWLKPFVAWKASKHNSAQDGHSEFRRRTGGGERLVIILIDSQAEITIFPWIDQAGLVNKIGKHDLRLALLLVCPCSRVLFSIV